MEAKLRIAEVLLKQARVLRNSTDPDDAIAAAEWEKRIGEEIEKLQKQIRRAEKKAVAA